jgi:hypothetical protein
MRRVALAAAASLAPLFAFGTPALAEDLEYLIQGKDRTHGDFAGRLALSRDADGATTGERWIQFLAGSDTLKNGRGTQADGEWTVRLVFQETGGLAGNLSGTSSSNPVSLFVEYEGEHDETISTRTRQNNRAKSRGVGFKVVTNPNAERPKAASSSHPYKPMKGVPLVKGDGDAHEVDVNDVAQGSLGDCYFMAGIAAVARTDPHRIRSMIETNADGSFSVYLWKHDHQWGEEVVDADGFFVPTVTATRIVVDDHFPSKYGSSPAYAGFGDRATINGEQVRELWPMILEKAYAQHKKGYKAIEGGWSSTPMSFFSGDDALVDHFPEDMTEAELGAVLKEAVKKGYPITMGSPKSVSSLGLYGNHYYIFAGLDDQGRVKLLNPWGSSHPRKALTLKQVKQHVDSFHVGQF